MNVQFLLSYLGYVGSGLLLILVFMTLYERMTPYRELALIRRGNQAAALSFGGALIGFTLSLASSALHALSWSAFLGWSAVAGAVQLIVFAIAAFGIRRVKQHIENDNRAVGLAMFFMSVAVGGLNAAALS